MKNLFLILFLIVAGVYGYHWYTTQYAPPPPVVAEEATPAPVIQRATLKPKVTSLQTNSLETHGLNGDQAGTPRQTSRVRH